MAEAPAPGVQFPQPLVNPPARGPQVPQVAQAAQVLPAVQGVPVPQAAQGAGQNAAQNVAADGQNELEVNF